ncbi:ATP-binding protein [Actinoplanes sp. Pm04-4]|uniref:ATP-binding protein n=1 Tax=Paractinoplanes pyxinae TaxID=2997416 RepID=A0ABT4ARW1_9ACTN|nr:ATP-binding protein [Actinoplanes pyxinae]MCY1136465.1 ATP-binding protein [Actinoplanes pyxinae]
MEPLRMVGPPARTSVLLTWSVESDTDLGRIREGIRQHFAAASEDRTAEHLGLVATELAGNALRHGLPPVVVRLLSDDDCYVVDVSDRAVQEPPIAAQARPGLHAGGRGLAICLALAERVGWHTTGSAKHVWAAFPRARP